MLCKKVSLIGSLRGLILSRTNTSPFLKAIKLGGPKLLILRYNLKITMGYAKQNCEKIVWKLDEIRGNWGSLQATCDVYAGIVNSSFANDR